MKKVLRSVGRWQQLSLLLLLVAVALGGYRLLRAYNPAEVANQSQRPEAEEEEEENRPDRPDLALAQDVALTRDPATGRVPRERLLAAKSQIDELLRGRAGKRQTPFLLSAATWTERGPNNIGGRLRALLPDPLDPTGNTVWAGSVGGGLWKTTTAASPTPTWSQVDDTFANLAVTTIAAEPTNPNTLYFGTGEGFFNADAIQGLGIWRSLNHGATWTQLPSTSNASFYFVQKLVVDKNGWLYAATGAGLQRSKDRGATWSTVLLAGNRLSDVDVSPATGAVYASLGVFTTGGGIYRSASGDAGTYTKLNTLPDAGLPLPSAHTRVEVALAPSDPNRLYTLFCSASTNGLLGFYRSLNGGDTWQQLPRPADADYGISANDFTRRQAWYDLALAVSPTDPNTVFVGGVDLFRTSTGGADSAAVAWQQVSHWYGGFGYQFVHADQHAIEFLPGSGARAYFGNDGGFATTANADAPAPTIRHGNTGLNVTQFYAVAAHPTKFDYFLAGAQDNGTQQFGALGGMVTRDISGGDGAFCFIDEDEPQFQFTTYVYSTIYRTSSGNNNPSNMSETLSSDNTGAFINPMEYDSKANVLYFGYSFNTLRRCVRATGPRFGDPALAPTFANIALPPNSGSVTHVAMSPNVADRVYVGTNYGRVVRIDNAAGDAPVVTVIYADPQFVSISCLAVEQSTPTPPAGLDPDQHLLVTIANYGSSVRNVRQSTDGGQSWTSAEGNLPDMPVRWALLDPSSGRRAMIATELGVWTTEDLSAPAVTWLPANTNLANVRVDMLRLRRADRTVVAATHGRGLFTTNIFLTSPLPVELTAFTATAQGPAAVALQWRTATEHNNRHFEVERSATGRDFGRLATVAGQGSKATPTDYALRDAALPPGATLLYYRLRQVDLDGHASYSPVRPVALAPVTVPQLLAYPNPARGTAWVQLLGPAIAAPLQVFDALGRLVRVQPFLALNTETTLPLAGLAPGAYVLRCGPLRQRLSVE